MRIRGPVGLSQATARKALGLLLVSGSACLVLAIVFGNCALSTPDRSRSGRIDAPNPAKTKVRWDWNKAGWWAPLSGRSSDFVPRGYGTRRPPSERAGYWVRDERDGKRLFVPKGGFDGISERVWKSEADKACTWRFSDTP